MAINNTVENINNQPTIEPRTITGIFTKYIAKTLPLAFDESMSYYECLCALLEYLNDTIVPDINNVNAGLAELQTFYEELQSYVNNYFDNLDVQEEINNKLDDMVSSGELTNLIRTYLDPYIYAQNTKINEIETKVNSVASGSPLVASSTSEMTDTTRTYVNTTDGKWYYYDGDSWEIGGTYQSTAIADGSITYDKLDSNLKNTVTDYSYTDNQILNLGIRELYIKSSSNNSTWVIHNIRKDNNNRYLFEVYKNEEACFTMTRTQTPSEYVYIRNSNNEELFALIEWNKIDSLMSQNNTANINDNALNLINSPTLYSKLYNSTIVNNDLINSMVMEVKYPTYATDENKLYIGSLALSNAGQYVLEINRNGEKVAQMERTATPSNYQNFESIGLSLYIDWSKLTTLNRAYTNNYFSELNLTKETPILEMLENKTIENNIFNKHISILGDSISTYGGYVTPSTNRCFYNGESEEENLEVTDTWWYKLIQDQGYILDYNNSYSGSPICNTGFSGADASSYSFLHRMDNIGRPDIIFVFGGTNDSWASVPLGNFKYSNWTTNDLKTFRPAYACLLDYLKSHNPNAKIYSIINYGISNNIINSMITISEYYDIQYITLPSYSAPYANHPDASGMNTIYNNVKNNL